MLQCLFSLISIALVTSAPAWNVFHHEQSCQYVMREYGLTGRFPGAVAHGIHSITLEDIRYYFQPTATENNRVPTLNYDLTDNRTVLPNAPLYGFDTSFYTVGMRHVDQVLRNMDKKNFYLTGYNTLEQLVHTFHMAEVWAKAKKHYERIVERPPMDEKLCQCVTDIKKNGIIKMLPFMSLKIRYPGITSKTLLTLPDGGKADWSGNLYNYSFFNEWSKELSSFNFNQDERTLLREATGKLQDGDKGIKHLDSEEMWKTWKAGMKGMVRHDDYELAMFLYCTLNH